MQGETDYTPVAYGETGPLKRKPEAVAASAVAGLVEKAKEQAEQAKAAFSISSVSDGMKAVFGNRKS